MSQDVTHEDFETSIVNLGDQPVVVATDIKDNVLADLIGGGEDGSDLGECVPVIVLGKSEPAIERALGFGVNRPEGPQLLPGDDMHRRSILSEASSSSV
jgi:hypothetical protein